jgi:GT2 family glycosyltransferase
MADAERAFSVVIPTRDTRELTLRCLASLGSTAAEVIVVDDGGSDGTAEEIARLHPAVRVMRNPASLGFTGTANRGLREARGRLLFLLNSDTEVEPDTLARLEAAFAASPRLGAAGASLRFPDGRPQWSGGRAPTSSWLFALSSGLPSLLEALPGYRALHPLDAERRSVDWVSGAAMVIRREAWDEVGPLDEGFAFYCQDLDFCLRLRSAGWEVQIVPGVSVLHHAGATIGSAAGSLKRRQHPALLWSDLVRLAGKHGGAAAARKAAATLTLGGRLRILSRSAATPLVPAGRRSAWREDTAAFRGALLALAAMQARASPRPNEAA